ncbi:MAG: DUF86 domain-containing protein [Bacteroidetes bacterium]|nr:MAG: DUF86 domain-containing protein [Bacteroidota bacterium]
MEKDEFVNDIKTNQAVVRSLEIIGEAVKNLPTTITKQYPSVPWADMARMRDKISHDYFGVDYDIVWRVIKERLPELKPILRNVKVEVSKIERKLILDQKKGKK